MDWFLGLDDGTVAVASYGDVAAAGTGVGNRNQGTGQAEACPAQPPLIGGFWAKKKRPVWRCCAPWFNRFLHPAILLSGNEIIALSHWLVLCFTLFIHQSPRTDVK